MESSTKLAVTFKNDVDLDAVYDCLRGHLPVKYCGLFTIDNGLCIYVQSTRKSTPMKMLELCRPFGAIGLPTPFNSRKGIFVSKRGEFRESVANLRALYKAGGAARCTEESYKMGDVSTRPSVTLRNGKRAKMRMSRETARLCRKWNEMC